MDMKFKQAIQIGSNVTDIMKLPCVLGAMKKMYDPPVIYYILFGDTITKRVQWVETVTAYTGDWLCEDYDGRWYLLNDKEYKDGLEYREQCAGA